MTLLVAAFAMLALFGISVPAAAAFALMFGAANGLITIARGAVPLALFGAAGYGALIGRIAGPSLLMQAAAPLALAFVIERMSDPAALACAAAFARDRAGVLCRDPAAAHLAVEQPNNESMSSCEEWPASPASFGPLRNFLSPSAALVEHDRLELLDAAPDFHQAADVLLEERQGLDHLADPLAGQVLEIAGLENLHHPVADVVGEALLVLALERGGQRVGALVDVLGGLQHLLRRLLGAAHDGRKLAARRARCRGGSAPPPASAATSSRLRLSAAWISLELGLVGLRLGDLRARLSPSRRGSAPARGSIRPRSALISAMNS